MPDLFAYTDGACSGNPGPGGWGVLLLAKDGETILKERTLNGGEPETTNNRMELTAAVQALRALPERSHVTLVTDSEYLKKGITEWLPNWRARNWRRKGGKLANVDLWKALDQILAQHEVEWRWVKAHASSRYNNLVDQLARDAMKRGI